MRDYGMSEPIKRCAWVTADPVYQQYHDTVWGRPETDSQRLFEKLCLDGQQAGLSWLTILKKQAKSEKISCRIYFIFTCLVVKFRV